MKFVVPVAMIAVLTVTGCARIASSPVNPVNWFKRGGGAEAQAQQPQDIRPLVPTNKIIRQVDGRALVQSLSGLEITPSSGGMIVRASGTAAKAGTYSTQLVEHSRSGGTLVLEFRTFQGEGRGPQNLTAAQFFTNGDLAGINRIEVISATNRLARVAR